MDTEAGNLTKKVFSRIYGGALTVVARFLVKIQ
jgi:hypothetical protein